MTAIESWLEALGSDDDDERIAAAEAPPEDAPEAEIVAALIPLLGDANPLVRLCAAETLGQFPGTSTAVALREYVSREPDPLGRAYGLSSLGLAGEPADLALLAAESASDRPAEVRIHALVGAYELARRAATAGLASLLRHEAPETRSSAAEALVSVLGVHDDEEAALAALEERARDEPIPAQREELADLLRELLGEDDTSE